MDNIITILANNGITIPEDKKQGILSALNTNYKTIAEHDRKIMALELERDNFKTKAATAEEALKKFEGIDPNAKAEYDKKIKDLTDQYNAEIAKRDRADAVKEHLSSVAFTSKYAQAEIAKRLTDSDLKLDNGKFTDFDKWMDGIKASDPEAFAADTGGKKAAKFTTGDPTKQQNTPMTKESILKIKDTAKRQKAIAENIELFNK